VRSGPYARDYNDMDFAVTSADTKRFKEYLIGQGYIGDQFFNGLHGESRLYYAASHGKWSIDVVIDELVMSHRLDLHKRLSQPQPTLPLADLLLSKLQDLGDMICLLADNPLSQDDADLTGLSLPRVEAVLGADWGFCHTVERNLLKVTELWQEEPIKDAIFDVGEQLRALSQAIERAPKSMAWRIRSRVGERMRWYETPEEVGH
jgi:hypothetical protein